MKFLFTTITHNRRLISIFTDALRRNLHIITRRRYSDQKTVGQQLGYRKVPAQGTISEHGYMLLIFPLTFTALGFWYVRKYNKINEMKESLSELYEREPVPLPENLSNDDLNDLQYRRIKVRGEFQYDKEFLYGKSNGPVSTHQQMKRFYITSLNARGYYLITPFKLEGRNYSIMINRGFLPEEAVLDKETRLLSQVHGPVELMGVLRQDQSVGLISYLIGSEHMTPKEEGDMTVFMARHVENMAKHCRSAKIFLDCLPQDFGQFTPVITAKAQPDIRNDAYMYAILWFSVAVYTTFMWYTAHKPKKITPLVYKLRAARR